MQPELKPPVSKLDRLPRVHAFAMALLVSLVVFFAAPPAQAAEKVAKLPVSIYCASYAADLKSVFVKNAPDRYQSISVSTANIIEAGEVLAEDGRILLYGPAGEDGTHSVVASAAMEGIRQPLIVIHPSTEVGKPAYAAKAVEADPAKFPLGGFNLLNLSPHPVRISHGEKVIELESDAAQIFTPEVPAGDGFAVTMKYKNGENWVLLSSARWALRKDRRSLVCFHQDPVSKRMNVKSVPLRDKPSR